MAGDLHSVVALAKGKPVVLVGHSVGGMINLTFARLYPELLGTEVVGMVQLDTTYTNPVRTTKNSGVSLALQKPVAEPLLHAMIALSPVIHAVNWLSYQEGLTHLRNAQSSFAGAETRGQLDLLSRSQAEASPAVVARGTLAMFHWDATSVLKQVQIPVLIVVGQEDTTTLPSASETMRNSIARSDLEAVHPGAHYALLERNDAVDSAIARFASSILK
jgi:pimeloyl-ACP methyl ester carboxylesterase